MRACNPADMSALRTRGSSLIQVVVDATEISPVYFSLEKSVETVSPAMFNAKCMAGR
jgi:hypothetical protein